MATTRMTTARYIVGDTRDVVATIPDNSIDFIMTSPPFLALRSYLPADHQDKWREIGSEPTPAAFIDMLLSLTAEWARVLAPHGSICVELGDSYSGSGGAGGDYADGGLRDGQSKFDGSAAKTTQSRRHMTTNGDKYADHPPHTIAGGTGWPLAKSKALIPELYRIALAYGVNPLTGQASPAGLWRVRNVVTWCRPNPPVGALGDKYRPATSDMVIACKSDRRWFDLDAVRTPHTQADPQYRNVGKHTDWPAHNPNTGWTHHQEVITQNPAGAPPLDYWVIPPQGYTGSHYAVYPPELCRIPILSMCPRHVCTVCGEPRRRIVEAEYVKTQATSNPSVRSAVEGVNAPGADQTFVHGRADKIVTTLGWSDCGHNTWRKGMVLDPFAGTFTTGLVATGNDRDAIGIDIDSRNADLAVERLGMFITIEHHTEAVA